jgi:hypothetical protein
MHIYNSYNLYLLHMNSSILRKRCAEYVNKVRLVKKNIYVKYRQDNLHRMTWYTSMYSIIAMGLLHMLALWSKLCFIWALDPMVVYG